MNSSKTKHAAKAKTRYHHGDLKEALINAAHELVSQKGPDHFSLTDACRLAGVSKSAPYRHFGNKDDLLQSVRDKGFKKMRQGMIAAAEDLVTGSNQCITAIGMAYIQFAVSEPALFKLMFGNSRSLPENDLTDLEGKPTFKILLDQVIARTKLQDIGSLMSVAFPLWTLVHGASMLIIDDSYRRIYPDSNTEQMITEATKRLLAEFPE